MPRSLQKGEIFRHVDDGTLLGKPRPLLILSRVELNGGYDLLVAPFTTRKLDVRVGRRQYVLFEAGEYGLPERCVLQLDSITRIPIAKLDSAQGRLGIVDSDRMKLIEASIANVFDL